jgi:hypothetical protein
LAWYLTLPLEIENDCASVRAENRADQLFRSQEP